MRRIILPFILLALVFVLIFSFFKFFRIGKIVCSSQFGNCESYIVTSLGKFEGLGFQESMNGVRTLLKNDHRIINFSVRFKLLNELRVDLIERKASVAVDDGSGKLKLYDKNGFFLGVAANSELPRITGVIDNSNLAFVIGLISDINILYNVKTAKAEGGVLIVNGIEGKTVIFPSSGNRDYLLGALSLILSRLPSVKEISTIDLRFKNPVLR